ncbi:MAG TPA: hypothetical protein V6D33_00250 [Cyanophyceae cyanobacterium]
MKQLLWCVCNVVLATTPIWGLQLAVAETRATPEGWRQPYTPTHLEWLLVQLASYNKPCVGREGYSAFYRWNQFNDDQVQLTILSNPDDLKFCASLALNELQIESSRLQLNPPTVVLLHYNQQSGTNKFWTCSVSAKIIRDSVVDFERACQAQ